MPLEPGTKLGPYQILEGIGAGGMGEVHKATDTRLNRTVAIKVLAARFSEDTEMRQRFEREAKAIGALNHPNICTLYDVGKHGDTDFLVMEFLEGETLASRLTRGPLPLEEALRVATAIAEALDKAHSQGVTHRDLKPGNVMLTASGAKLLDFGLAKLGQPSAAQPAPAPTGGDSTIPGTILGTMPYMAPEQLEGENGDARTDVFAFGAVLYEMVTGKRAFDGKSQALLIAAIISADPEPISKLVPTLPPALEFTVARCLAKDPEQRMQTAWDLVCQLRWIAEGTEDSGASEAQARLRRREYAMRAALAAVMLLIVVLAIPTFLYLRGSNTPDPTRFLVNIPDMPVPEAVAISPDGQSIAYSARDTRSTGLFVRSIDSLASTKVAGTEGAGRLFWSPDSKSVAFFASGQLKRVGVAGGLPSNICETPDMMGGTWNADNVIVFASSKGLYRVRADGGEPSPIAGAAEKPDNRREPFFLPDGRHYLYLTGSGTSAAIQVGQLDSTATTQIIAANSNPVYVDPGYLLYHRDGTLYAHSFSARKLAVSGEAIRIADGIPNSSGGGGAFSASQSGILIYRSMPPAPSGPAVGQSTVVPNPLLWVDRSGRKIQQLGPQEGWVGVDLSPDGKRVAVHRHDSDGGDIHIFEPGLELPVRFTFEAGQDNSSPVWSPDGKKIAFGSRRDGKWGLYTKLSDNTGTEDLLQQSESPIVPMSWTRDNVLVYTTRTLKTASDIWYLRLGSEKKEPIAFLQNAADERHPQVSPDGKWIAYSSNNSGRSEIYIRPFPSGPGLIQISVNGGVFPRWRGDGKQLYFMSLVSVGGMMAVDLSVRGSEIHKDADPQVLFQTGFFDGAHAGGYSHAYAVSADGQRFLLPQVDNILAGLRGNNAPTLVTTAAVAVSADRQGANSPGGFAPINVVLHWTSTLGK